MNKQLLKILSIFVVFFFGAHLLFPPESLAESPCWNEASIAYGEGGNTGATDTHPGDINQPSQTEVADPIDVANGNYSYENQDLIIPSRGLPLEIRRYYNSLDSYEGPFGIGWSHSYNIFLLEVSNGSETYIVRRNANGSKDKFLKNPDDSFTASSGCYDTLSKEADGYLIQDKHGLNFHFELDGKLKSITNRNQNRISLEYDSQADVLTKVTDSLNRSIEFNYNAQHKVTSIVDFTGRTTTYEYDQEDNLVYITTPPTENYPSGLTTTYTYDDQHRLTSITDAKGQTYISLVYNENSRVIELDSGLGTNYFAYQANLTTYTDPKDFTTEYKLNPNGTVNTKKQYTKGLRDNVPQYYTTEYEYNENGEYTKIIYPERNWIKYTYDDKGNILEIRKKQRFDPDIDRPERDIVTTFTYEPKYNFVKTITDPRENNTTYDYDEKGNLIQITYPEVDGLRPTTLFTYNQYGQMETVTNPNGTVTKYEYDPSSGYLTKIINDYGTESENLNYTTEMTYDSVGNVTSITNARGHTTTFAYNALNQLTQTTSPAPFNYLTIYSYDENGNLKRIERQADNAGTVWQTTDYTYTNVDQLSTITDDLGNVTTFDYDANGNRTSIQDAELNIISYQYDERNFLWKVVDALGNITEYTYDKNGNLKEIKDARLNKTVYTYDGFDRLITTTYEDGTAQNYTYDKNSNLTSKTDQEDQTITYDYDQLNRLVLKTYPDTSTVHYTYDIASRLTSIENPASSIQYTYDNLNRVKQTLCSLPAALYSISYEYDAVGNRTKLAYPDLTSITYTYDELNRLTSIKDQTSSLIASYTYDALSRRTQLDFANNTQTTYQYDELNRLTSIEHPASSCEYTYDKAGNRKTMVVDSTDTHSYTYDDIYQLTQVTSPTSQVTSYNYDSVGNRTSTVNGGTTTYLPNEMNQYDSVGGITYTYDANGNLTSDGTNTYQYDYENRLIKATTSDNIVEYEYDAFGRRISKKTCDASYSLLATDYFLYDGDQVICEYDSSSTLLRKFIYGPGIDEPILLDDGTNKYYYHFDGLGSVTALTDSSGSTIETYSYDAYGQPSTTSSIGNPYLFTARRLDPETNLYYYRARYYSPKVGRFLQRDPVGYIAGINLYTYCENNPVNWFDPYGLDKQKDEWWKWGPENWLWQYLYGGGELADPRFWLVWGEEFQGHRLPGTGWFSLLEWPWGLSVSYGLTKGGTAIQHAAYRMTWSGTKFTSLGRSGLYFTGKRVGWQRFGTAVKGFGYATGFATAASTGADIGTWIYSYYTAHERYYKNER